MFLRKLFNDWESRIKMTSIGNSKPVLLKSSCGLTSYETSLGDVVNETWSLLHTEFLSTQRFRNL